MIRRLILALAAAAALLGSAPPAAAIPRFAARYGQTCILCHQDPTGGGLRSLYASQFLVPNELVMARLPDSLIANIDPQVGKNLIVGADVQTLYLATRRTPTESGFLQMQATLYLDFHVGERWSAQMVRREQGDFQALGLGFVLPASGYVKVGRFWPAFGLRLEDHTAFVRRGLGYIPPTDSDTGLEMGVYPGAFYANAGVFNGELGSIFDNDRGRALLGRAGVRLRLGGLLVSGGGSVWRNPVSLGDTAGTRGTRVNYGPFGTLSLGPATWLGEFDWSRLNTPTGHVTALYFSQELSWRLCRGLDLLGTYDFADSDWSDGGNTQERFGAGLDARIYPCLRLGGRVNWGQFTAGYTDLVGTGQRDTEVVLTLLSADRATPSRG